MKIDVKSTEIGEEVEVDSCGGGLRCRDRLRREKRWHLWLWFIAIPADEDGGGGNYFWKRDWGDNLFRIKVW
jgi:hypothetical protein